MKRLIVMLGISLLVAGGFLCLDSEARSAISGRAQGVDQELIRDVQRQLKGLGFNPGAVDGNYGEQTGAALRAYQQAYRLPVTGRLDETTLRSILPERFEASRPPLDLSNREVLQQGQRQLKALGFDPGTMDGTFGPQTEAALRAYQQAYRLPQTGRLDDVTLRSLLPERFEASRTSVEPPNREVLRQAQRLPQTGRPDEATLRSLLPEKREGTLH
jgi:peptidoglycan hydrolase-like protein with peptidoglycan-binding domain